MGYIIKFWKSILTTFFLDLWTSIWFWRSLSFILLGVIAALFIFKENIQRWLLRGDAVKHDKELFKLLDLVMNERKLLDILKHLEEKNFYNIRSGEYIDKFRVYLGEESRQYIVPKLKKSALLLAEAINALRDFIDKNFILFPDAENSQECTERMYPNPNIDGGGNAEKKDGSKFLDFKDELAEKINLVKKQYQRYRGSVKQILHV